MITTAKAVTQPAETTRTKVRVCFTRPMVSNIANYVSIISTQTTTYRLTGLGGGRRGGRSPPKQAVEQGVELRSLCRIQRREEILFSGDVRG